MPSLTFSQRCHIDTVLSDDIFTVTVSEAVCREVQMSVRVLMGVPLNHLWWFVLLLNEVSSDE